MDGQQPTHGLVLKRSLLARQWETARSMTLPKQRKTIHPSRRSSLPGKVTLAEALKAFFEGNNCSSITFSEIARVAGVNTLSCRYRL
jgi:hypothetical protein